MILFETLSTKQDQIEMHDIMIELFMALKEHKSKEYIINLPYDKSILNNYTQTSPDIDKKVISNDNDTCLYGSKPASSITFTRKSKTEVISLK